MLFVFYNAGSYSCISTNQNKSLFQKSYPVPFLYLSNGFHKLTHPSVKMIHTHCVSSWIYGLNVQKCNPLQYQQVDNKPVVNSNIGWAQELMENEKSGYLVHPTDHKFFAEKINMRFIKQVD